MASSNTLNVGIPRYAKPLLKPARYRAVYGGRGSSKSHTIAQIIIMEHVADPNKRTVCIREVQKSIKWSVKQLLEDYIERMGVQDHFEILHDQIKSTKGRGVIIFQGMQNHTKESIKSLEGFSAWVEEAQTLSQQSLDMLRPTIRMPGTGMLFSWNPVNETDAIDRLLRCENPPPDAVVVQANYRDNPWLPEDMVTEMRYDRDRDPEKFAHVWLGGYLTNSNKRVFKNWAVEEFDTPNDAMFRFGADWGFSQDPTTLVRCFLEGRKLYIDYEAYQVGCEIMDTPDLFMSVPESEKWPIIADSARPETISHVRKHGFPKVMGAAKGKNSLMDGVEFLKSYDIVVHPRCKHVIDELTLYSYKVDPMTDAVLPVLEDKNNHCIDALRYACESLRRGANKKDRKPVPAPPQITTYW